MRKQMTMNHLSKILSFMVLIPLMMMSCGKSKSQENVIAEVEKKNSIYHWKTTFNLDSVEVDFLKKHDVKRIYLHMFDVVFESNAVDTEIVPIATTKFITKVPEGVEIVPVAYITIDALRYLDGNKDKVKEYAPLIVERLLAMCSYNECGTINELQLDCDWTSTTQETYFKLCEMVKSLLQNKNIDLSVTIRLHQLKDDVPPADRGVLMLYNTGALKDKNTKNSILDIANVKPYLKKRKYGIPLDYAYPCYGWGIKFDKGNFAGIVGENYTPANSDEKVRVERATVSEVLDVKKLVEEKLGKPYSGNILYHLDEAQLKHYTEDEINQILVY